MKRMQTENHQKKEKDLTEHLRDQKRKIRVESNVSYSLFILFPIENPS
jgi:hypothetical protein